MENCFSNICDCERALSEEKTTWEKSEREDSVLFMDDYILLKPIWLSSNKLWRRFCGEGLQFTTFPDRNGLTRISYGGDPSGSGAVFPEE